MSGVFPQFQFLFIEKYSNIITKEILVAKKLFNPYIKIRLLL